MLYFPDSYPSSLLNLPNPQAILSDPVFLQVQYSELRIAGRPLPESPAYLYQNTFVYIRKTFSLINFAAFLILSSSFVQFLEDSIYRLH